MIDHHNNIICWGITDEKFSPLISKHGGTFANPYGMQDVVFYSKKLIYTSFHLLVDSTASDPRIQTGTLLLLTLGYSSLFAWASLFAIALCSTATSGSRNGLQGRRQGGGVRGGSSEPPFWQASM